jgi:hypothetical protein
MFLPRLDSEIYLNYSQGSSSIARPIQPAPNAKTPEILGQFR